MSPVNSDVARKPQMTILTAGHSSSDVGVQATPVAAEANQSTNSSDGEITQSNQMVTNTKEKTPMCLVNELARFNKVQHRYVLEDEQGPAHQKVFTIRLEIGSENYKATGSSIKRAQHSAADIALHKTPLLKPVIKNTHKPTKLESLTSSSGPPPPTVKLNSLCMKYGWQAEYKNLDVRRPFNNYNGGRDSYRRQNQYNPRSHDQFASGNRDSYRGAPRDTLYSGGSHDTFNGPQLARDGFDAPGQLELRPPGAEFGATGRDQRGGYRGRGRGIPYNNYNSQPWNCVPPYIQSLDDLLSSDGWIITTDSYMPMMARPPSYGVMLTICDQEFRGEGPTRQTARHAAANKALKTLKSAIENDEEQKGKKKSRNLVKPEQKPDSSENLDDKTDVEVDKKDTHTAEVTEEDDSDNSLIKSAISQVHELSLRHDMKITFEIIHESGPPHLRTFVTRCVCGYFTSEGEGNSKKDSKKKCAESMLSKLSELPQRKEPENKPPRQKNLINKKKNRNLIKLQKATVDYGTGINPISRLIQIQQANKKAEPKYSLVDERGLPRKREFIIKVECNDKSCEGRGPNKKLAKRNAAETMLQLLGYNKPFPNPGKSVLKQPGPDVQSITTQSNNIAASREQNKHVTFKDVKQLEILKIPGVLVKPNSASGDSANKVKFNEDIISSMADQLLSTGVSNIAQQILPDFPHPNKINNDRDKLEYLAKLANISLEVTDFGKGTNTNQCLCLITVTVSSPKLYHGCAPTIDESHDLAALHALTDLASKCKETLNKTAATPDSASDSAASTSAGDATLAAAMTQNTLDEK